MIMTFRRDHFPIQTYHTTLERVSSELLSYFRTTPVIDILQVFIDVAQQNGYNAKQTMERLIQTAEDKSGRVTDREIFEAQVRCSALFRLTHDFVDLRKYCTGTWKPKRQNRRSEMRGRSMQTRSQNRNYSTEDRRGRTYPRGGPTKMNDSRSLPRTAPQGPAKTNDFRNNTEARRGPYQSRGNYQSGSSYMTGGRPQQGMFNRNDSERRTYQPGSYQFESNHQSSQNGDSRGQKTPMASLTAGRDSRRKMP